MGGPGSGRRMADPQKRFAKHLQTGDMDCIVWTGGDWWWAGDRPVRPHRWAWEMFYGPAPHNVPIMRTCLTKKCVNPHHLKTKGHDNPQPLEEREVPA